MTGQTTLMQFSFEIEVFYPEPEAQELTTREMWEALMADYNVAVAERTAGEVQSVLPEVVGRAARINNGALINYTFNPVVFASLAEIPDDDDGDGGGGEEIPVTETDPPDHITVARWEDDGFPHPILPPTPPIDPRPALQA